MSKQQIGQALADERKRRGLSIRQMAALAGISTRQLQAIEKGWYNVGFDSYLLLADKLDQRIVLQSK